MVFGNILIVDNLKIMNLKRENIIGIDHCNGNKIKIMQLSAMANVCNC